MLKKDICFIDLETTGLDPNMHEIIEVAAIHCTLKDGELVENFSMHALVKPTHIETADPKALEINGYDADRWAFKGRSIHEVLTSITVLLFEAIPAGHNIIGFDWPFLMKAYQNDNSKPLSVDHHMLDTMALAWPLWASGQIESVSLAAVCQHFGIDFHHHRAMEDARASLAAATAMLNQGRVKT